MWKPLQSFFFTAGVSTVSYIYIVDTLPDLCLSLTVILKPLNVHFSLSP